eukprot:1822836-Amphidinium_carterae.1
MTEPHSPASQEIESSKCLPTKACPWSRQPVSTLCPLASCKSLTLLPKIISKPVPACCWVSCFLEAKVLSHVAKSFAPGNRTAVRMYVERCVDRLYRRSLLWDVWQVWLLHMQFADLRAQLDLALSDELQVRACTLQSQ